MGYITEPKGIDFLIESPPLNSKRTKSVKQVYKNTKSKTEA